jgi:hypothetical protein
MEQELKIKENGKYKNLDLNELEDGNYVVVQKDGFNEAKEFDGKFGKGYICTVLYKGEKCTFILNKKDLAEKFNNIAGLGDALKISISKKIGKITFKKDGKVQSRDGVIKTISIDNVE